MQLCVKKPSVHSKLYIWLKNGNPFKAYIGSANYTQTAFLESKGNREIVSEIECYNCLDYFNMIERDSIYCNFSTIEDSIRIINDKKYFEKYALVKDDMPELAGSSFSSVKVSLLDRHGEIHNKAGLNWGQREGRDKNQAYLQLPSNVYRSDFFPIRSVHFTVLTDDNKTIICTRAQKDTQGHAIETPHNNSILGEYFRHRLGLPSGAFVKKSDLLKYGRTDVEFYKIDDENYFMDFSVG